MARQPEVSKDVRGSMIVIAALLEGATFFGLLICLLCLVL
jgi:F-type H+-transporting ATPase subunit c